MDELSDSDKIELYKLLVANGFDTIDEQIFKQSPLAENYDLEKIEKILKTYKKSNDYFGELTSKLLHMKQYYKSDCMSKVFADILMIKAEKLDKKEYKSVYRFLANLLQGNLPELTEFDEKSMNIILSLMRDAQLLVNSIDHSKLLDESDEKQKNEDQEKALKMLQSMFRVQHLSEFMNPLNITNEMNYKLLEILLKNMEENQNFN